MRSASVKVGMIGLGMAACGFLALGAGSLTAKPAAVTVDVGKAGEYVHYRKQDYVFLSIRRTDANWNALSGLGSVTCQLKNVGGTVIATWDWQASLSKNTSDPKVATFCFYTKLSSASGFLTITIDDPTNPDHTPVKVVGLPTEPNGPRYPCPDCPNGSAVVINQYFANQAPVTQQDQPDAELQPADK